MSKIACRAVSWYNDEVNLNMCLPSTRLAPPRAVCLNRRHTVDTLPSHDQNGNLSIPATGGIYKITCTVNGKFYIGSAVNLYTRHYDHFSTLRRSTHKNIHLQRAYNKYGKDAFTFEILELVPDREMLTTREQHWFDELQPFGDQGYNIAPNAISLLGKRHTPETRAKISQAHMGMSPTPETREKLRQANLGKKMPPSFIEKQKARIMKPETRAKLQGRKWTPEQKANLKAIRNTPEALERNRQAQLGKKLSPETKEKLRQASTGKKMSPEAIKKSWANRRAKQEEARKQNLDGSQLDQ